MQQFSPFPLRFFFSLRIVKSQPKKHLNILKGALSSTLNVPVDRQNASLKQAKKMIE